MRTEPIVRAGVAGLCVAGVVASAITYRSEHRLDQAFGSAILGRPGHDTAKLANGSRLLHPDTRADIAKAVFALHNHDGIHAVAYAEDATRREPENAAAWLTLARIEAGVRHPGRARAAYARAKALDPQLPRTPAP
jgi:cytochrome c-type biogenesis protein CcmH/NrfG